MVNESTIVEPDIIDKLQRVSDHLSRIENRSFIVLGNFPLTFGSMTSVSKLGKFSFYEKKLKSNI